MKRKTMVLTGANGTIGFEIAKLAVRADWNLILTCRKEHEPQLREMIESDLKRYGTHVHTFLCDMNDERSINAAAKDIAHFGYDCLINNAGYLLNEKSKPHYLEIKEWFRGWIQDWLGKTDDPDRGEFSKHYHNWCEVITDDMEVFDTMHRVNLRGPYYLTRLLAPFARSNARIINICSDANAFGRPDLNGYIAAKGGLESLSLALNKDYEDISVVPVRIGWTSSNMSDFNPLAMPAPYVASRIFQVAATESISPADNKIYCVGPVFKNEALPSLTVFKYDENFPSPYKQ